MALSYVRDVPGSTPDVTLISIMSVLFFSKLFFWFKVFLQDVSVLKRISRSLNRLRKIQFARYDG